MNKAVFAVIIANFTFDYSYYTLLITMPLFLKDVHNYAVATVSNFSLWCLYESITIVGAEMMHLMPFDPLMKDAEMHCSIQ